MFSFRGNEKYSAVKLNRSVVNLPNRLCHRIQQQINQSIKQSTQIHQETCLNHQVSRVTLSHPAQKQHIKTKLKLKQNAEYLSELPVSCNTKEIKDWTLFSPTDETSFSLSFLTNLSRQSFNTGRSSANLLLLDLPGLKVSPCSHFVSPVSYSRHPHCISVFSFLLLLQHLYSTQAEPQCNAHITDLTTVFLNHICKVN